MKRLLLSASALLAIGFGSASAFIRIFETELIFHPAERVVASPPASLALSHRDIRIPSVDGGSLGAWVIPAAAKDSLGMWMLVCHGNYGNIGFGGRPEFYAFARETGLNLLAFDYRGFGGSTGEPSEANAYADARAAYDYLRDTLGVPAERIILFGHSLGSGVAIELATHVGAAALVVEGAFTSVVDRGSELYPWLPVRRLATQKFLSIDRVGTLRLPKLFLHSPDDDVIPYAHGERLFSSAAEPKRFIPVQGGHDGAFRTDRSDYFGAIRELAESVLPRLGVSNPAPSGR